MKLAGAAKYKFDLPLRRIEPLLDKRARFLGDVTTEHDIRLRLYRLGRPREPLSQSTILGTLAHELAHLKYMKHGRKHRAFTREILIFWNGR